MAQTEKTIVNWQVDFTVLVAVSRSEDARTQAALFKEKFSFTSKVKRSTPYMIQYSIITNMKNAGKLYETIMNA